MVFASLEFLTLFLPLFFAFYLLTPQRFRNHTLLVGSWIFYAWWTPKFLILIIALTLLAWGAAILIDKTSDEKMENALDGVGDYSESGLTGLVQIHQYAGRHAE